MSVFISYHRPDEDRAVRLSAILKAGGIRTYLDVMDPSLETTADITSRIVLALHSCSHLLALISRSTRDSWWVPFEIGVATESDRRIASFNLAPEPLPHYLKAWPILRTDGDLQAFIRRYHEDASTPADERSVEGLLRGTLTSARQFHAALRKDLGQ